jgi:hypothetical protein
MTAWQNLGTHLLSMVVFLALAGLVRRDRVRLCWSFSAYLLALGLGNTLVAVWPERFFTSEVWIVQQTVYNALKVAVAIELGLRVFRAFPAAELLARRALLTGMAVTTLLLVALPAGADYRSFLDHLLPRILQGTIWLLNGLALVIVWYRLPVHPFHKAVLAGFVPYLLIFVTLLNVCRRFDWSEWIYELYSAADLTAFLLVNAYWALAAWKPEAAAGRGGTLEALQRGLPRAVRLGARSTALAER